jgi:TonB family protein
MKAVVNDNENRTKGLLISLVFHTLLVLLMFLYTFAKKPESTEIPPISIEWGGGGDNAAAGEPDKGMGEDYTPPGEQSSPAPTTPAAATPVATPRPTPTPTAPPQTATSDDPEVAAVRKQQEKERKKQEEAYQQEQIRQAEEFAKQKAAADAKAAAEAKRNKVKNDAGGAFNGKKNSSGAGAGGGGNAGNGGINGGTGDNPFGKSSGSGGGSGGGDGTGTGASVGGGLGGRKITNRGRIDDRSQKEGKVVIAVCVDTEGQVTSADYRYSGSTMQDTELKNKAIAAAKGYRFGPSQASQECGTITFVFKLK